MILNELLFLIIITCAPVFTNIILHAELLTILWHYAPTDITGIKDINKKKQINKDIFYMLSNIN